MDEFVRILEIIQQGQTKALQAANYHFLEVYWQVGGYISTQQKNKVWGEKIVDNLAAWLKTQNPTLKGFDRRSLYRMKSFFDTWTNPEMVEMIPKTLPDKILKPEKTENKKNINSIELTTKSLLPNDHEIVGTVSPQFQTMPFFLSRINWSMHLELLRSTSNHQERLFYFALAIKEQYKVRELRRQIESCTFERQVLTKSNSKVEHPGKEKFHNIFKDVYIAEFLDLPTPFSESDLQNEIVKQMQYFILELGRDFVFIGREFKIQVGTHDYYLDLLFYHRELNCLVVFELKNDIFKPEHLGKLQFYLEALDRDVKKTHENPSIGVLLCKTHDAEVVEYAMSRNISPALITKYETILPQKQLLREKIQEIWDSGIQ